MSMLEKMMVQGIRSFGPQESDRQMITFFTPLTLILGQNGSGKTTIIESLRYMTTGDYPPNSGKGQTFVHDPKLSGEIEVKAQIRLQFRDVKNERRNATRSMVATRKAKMVSFKTLEGYIQCKTADGETATVTSKCVDLNLMIPEHFGVSKAVLNNVIFCHQEESNWPLGEGKQVKDRFDEIFSAKHYILALENIRNIRKKLMNDIKLFKSELVFLEQNKDKAKQISLDLKNTETRLLSSRNRVQEINNRLTPIEEKLICLSATEGEIHQIEMNLANQNTLLKQLNANKKDLLDMIQDVFVGTVDDLQREIRSFTAEMDKKKTSQNDAKRKKSMLDSENERHRKQQSRLNLELGKLRTLEQQQKDRTVKRDGKISTIAEELGISGFTLDSGESFTEEQISSFMSQLQKRIDLASEEYQKTKVNYEKQESKLQSNMDQIRDKRTQGEQKLKMNNEQLVKNRNETDSISRELRRVDSNALRQHELESKLKDLDAEQSKLEKSVNVEQLKSSIQSLQKKKSSLSSQLNLLNQEMSKLQLESEKRTEQQILEKDKAAKEELIRKITSRNEDALNNLLGKVPTHNLYREVEVFTNNLNSETKSMQADILEMKTRISGLEMKRSHLVEELKKNEGLLSSHQDKIYHCCGSDDFEESLKAVQKTLQELQNEKGELTGRKFIYGKYVEKLEARKPCCPLCQRGFAEDSEAVELKSHIRRQIDIVPEQLKIKERHIAEQDKKLETLLGLKPLQKEISLLSTTTIPEKKQKLKAVNEEIEELRKEINDAEDVVEMKQMDLASCASIQPDMILLHQHQSELRKLDSKLEDIKGKLQSDGEFRTLQQVNSEREDAQNDFQKTMKEVEEQQERLSAHSEKVNSLQSQINTKRSELLQITADQQKRQSLLEQKTKLSSEIALLEKAILESKEEIKSHEATWQTVKSELDQVRSEKEMDITEIQSQVDTLRNHKHNVDQNTKEIQRYIKEGHHVTLKDAERKIEEVKSTIDEKDVELKRASETIQKLEKEIANQAVRERELRDNMSLKECDAKILDVKKKCDDLEKKLHNIDTTNLFKEKKELTQEHHNLRREKDQAEERMRIIQEQISKHKKDLLSDQFKDADAKYKSKLIDSKTSELASDDLNKFYKALDAAVMKHHKMKMDEINKIVRELWKRTYKGHDIEYIEIRSDHTESSSDKRRTYNYRVVMICGESELDMRGRCSAGQKVLASLIIRLALAETFCLNCGILALDEPTTNLDRDNIESLAYALVEVVKSRHGQKNFQLVIITHDEDFIQLLGRAHFCEYFWKVGKDANAYTKLQKCLMTELNA